MAHDTAGPDRALSRRRLVALLGLSGVGVIAGRARAQAPAAGTICVVRPRQTEGPYYVDERLERSDIRGEPTGGGSRPGVNLDLVFAVGRLTGGGCAAVTGAVVDVWHCDATGVYSDVRDPGGSTVGQKFLRGFQRTDASGLAGFTTIYPGWYPGRAVHIHFKIRTDGGREFTSQIYFDEAVNDRVFAAEPYGRRGPGRLRNEADGLYRGGGRQLTVTPTPSGRGYAVRFEVALGA